MNTTAAGATPGEAPFSLAPFRPTPFRQSLLNVLMQRVIPALFGLLRGIAPVFRVPFTNIVLVTRFDDVQEICSRHNEFPVPYRPLVDAIDWTPAFLLALKDTPDYRRMLGEVHALWSPGDIPFVRPATFQLRSFSVPLATPRARGPARSPARRPRPAR